jgi:integrase
MSGHSKWSTIKRKKGAQDEKRGKLYAKLLRQIEVAAREGGPNVEGNMTLASAVQKAKDNSVPVDNIDRAIKRGAGEMGGARYEEITYEGYGPGGVAILVEVMTDNRNRTGQEVRHTFAKLYLLNGGDLFSLQRILGHTTLDMVRRYVNLDTGEVKRQHAQASPVDRLAIGPRVSVLLPWPVADRLEELAFRKRTSVEELVKRGAQELIERGRDGAVEQSPSAA